MTRALMLQYELFDSDDLWSEHCYLLYGEPQAAGQLVTLPPLLSHPLLWSFPELSLLLESLVCEIPGPSGAKHQRQRAAETRSDRGGPNWLTPRVKQEKLKDICGAMAARDMQVRVLDFK